MHKVILEWEKQYGLSFRSRHARMTAMRLRKKNQVFNIGTQQKQLQSNQKNDVTKISAAHTVDFDLVFDIMKNSSIFALKEAYQLGNKNSLNNMRELEKENYLKMLYLKHTSRVESYAAMKAVLKCKEKLTTTFQFGVFHFDWVSQQKAIEEAVQDDLEQDKGLLDVDFLEFNELEGDAGLSQNELDEFREIDINALDVDFLPDLLDVIEELIRTTEKLEDAQQVSGAFRLDGAIAGFNKDSQYNIFEEDGDIVFYRSVNGTIRLQLEMDSSVRLDTFTETWEGTILLNGGDDIIIVITQRN